MFEFKVFLLWDWLPYHSERTQSVQLFTYGCVGEVLMPFIRALAQSEIQTALYRIFIHWTQFLWQYLLCQNYLHIGLVAVLYSEITLFSSWHVLASLEQPFLCTLSFSKNEQISNINFTNTCKTNLMWNSPSLHFPTCWQNVFFCFVLF